MLEHCYELAGKDLCIPIQTPLVGRNPMVASTHAAHVVILYTKAKGK